jgi:hypothetical protein
MCVLCLVCGLNIQNLCCYFWRHDCVLPVFFLFVRCCEEDGWLIILCIGDGNILNKWYINATGFLNTILSTFSVCPSSIQCPDRCAYAANAVGKAVSLNHILHWRMPSSWMCRRVVYSYLLTLVHRSWISYTLKMKAIRSSETSVNNISTWRHIPVDGILHSHRRENLKSDIFYILLAKTVNYICS